MIYSVPNDKRATFLPHFSGATFLALILRSKKAPPLHGGIKVQPSMNRMTTFLSFILLSSLVQAESYSEEELREIEEQEKFLEAYATDLEEQSLSTRTETYITERIEEQYEQYYEETL